jgi:hypothetical protein
LRSFRYERKYLRVNPVNMPVEMIQHILYSNWAVVVSNSFCLMCTKLWSSTTGEQSESETSDDTSKFYAL